MKRLIDHAADGLEVPAAPVPRIEAKPTLGSLDMLDLPVTQVMQPPVRDEVLDASDGLDNLTQLALGKAKEILEMALDPSDDSFNPTLKAVSSMVQTVLTTQVRVDESRFKKKTADTLGKLLALMSAEEAKLVRGGRVLN